MQNAAGKMEYANIIWSDKTDDSWKGKGRNAECCWEDGIFPQDQILFGGIIADKLSILLVNADTKGNGAVEYVRVLYGMQLPPATEIVSLSCQSP